MIIEYPFNYSANAHHATDMRERKATRRHFINKWKKKITDPLVLAEMMKELGMYSEKTSVRDVSFWIKRTIS